MSFNGLQVAGLRLELRWLSTLGRLFSSDNGRRCPVQVALPPTMLGERGPAASGPADALNRMPPSLPACASLPTGLSAP